MFREESTKLFSDIFLNPYSLTDLRLLVCLARQDFVNSVMNLRTLELAKREIDGAGFLGWWRRTRKIEKAVRVAKSEIREKRILLDDLERALDLSSHNNHYESEKREFYLDALKSAEEDDESRYEKRLKNIEKDCGQMSETKLLFEIRRQLAEIFFSIDKMNYQNKRRCEWEMYDPPERVREDFKNTWDKLSKPNQIAGVDAEPPSKK